MFIRARAVDSRYLVMVAAKYFLGLRNVLQHRSRSADVICNVIEIDWNTQQLDVWKEFMAKTLTALLERACSALSHLRYQRKSRHMKIMGDGSLTDVYFSLSEHDTE